MRKRQGGLARGLTGIVAALALLEVGALAALAVPGPGPAPPADHLPSGLPRHLGIGLSAAPTDLAPGGWMPASGIRWDYAYQYLAGGVNTSSRWQEWNQHGTFPILYARRAAADGYLPVLTYYEVKQSAGNCSQCPEAQRDLAHLNDAALMRAYFADFATLMQRLGPHSYGGVAGYGHRVVVQVEPDLSGFAEKAVLDPVGSCYRLCTATGNSPSFLRAAVRASRYPAVAGYPNTYQGFSLALAHLRDLYAPNVVLGFHVSDWATAIDIGSDRANVDAGALGRKAGNFARAAGANGTAYQLVFNDVADRDAAASGGVWWDRTNGSLPDFARWETYLGAVTATTSLPAFVWQVPEGNQYFTTENNSYGHTQDNRAEYFFAHPTQLTAAGVVAVLFGAGNPGSTTNTDADHDGVIHPVPVCSTSGGGPACPAHLATVSDDDGGYLRMAAARYYTHPAPLP
jgi:hypothetical protein